MSATQARCNRRAECGRGSGRFRTPEFVDNTVLEYGAVLLTEQAYRCPDSQELCPPSYRGAVAERRARES